MFSLLIQFKLTWFKRCYYWLFCMIAITESCLLRQNHWTMTKIVIRQFNQSPWSPVQGLKKTGFSLYNFHDMSHLRLNLNFISPGYMYNNKPLYITAMCGFILNQPYLYSTSVRYNIKHCFWYITQKDSIWRIQIYYENYTHILRTL